MSGGSFNYIFSRLETECAGNMQDDELNELITDLCEVLHDLEWWQSSDISEEQYRETVKAFKDKWIQGTSQSRLEGHMIDHIESVKNEIDEFWKNYYGGE